MAACPIKPMDLAHRWPAKSKSQIVASANNHLFGRTLAGKQTNKIYTIPQPSHGTPDGILRRPTTPTCAPTDRPTDRSIDQSAFQLPTSAGHSPLTAETTSGPAPTSAGARWGPCWGPARRPTPARAGANIFRSW